jgi:hypothetical protein
VRGKHCTAIAPGAWAFTGENPAGNAFGADIARQDGSALASYFLVGITADLRTSPVYGRWYATPQQAVMATLTQLGRVHVQCGAAAMPVPGLQLMSCRTPQHEGIALWQSYPMAGNGFVIVIRTAATTIGGWERNGELASAVSRSIRCNVPLRPSSADFTSGPSGTRKPSRGGEGDSQYSRWTGMEHYHDSRTGQNYWVSSSRDWNESGPQGPGYYARIGGELRKLEPGRSD